MQRHFRHQRQYATVLVVGHRVARCGYNFDDFLQLHLTLQILI